MHTEDISAWTHHHRFETGNEAAAERRTLIVVALTLTMMVVEIGVGLLTNSMALLADGFHMSTHAGALGIAAFAYWHARKHADDRRYTFGTGKVGALAGFTSAIILIMVALLMVWESLGRLHTIQTIAFNEALWIAAIGLAVNMASAFILGAGHGHGHDHDHAGHHDHHHHHDDHNLRAAYLHVVADTFTSVLAIVSLLLGKYFGWWWMDPLMGVVGAVVIVKWAWALVGRSGNALLDMSDDDALAAEVKTAIEADADNCVADLHLWQVGPGHWAAIVSVVTATPRPPQHYRSLLSEVHELSHVTIEVEACR